MWLIFKNSIKFNFSIIYLDLFVNVTHYFFIIEDSQGYRRFSCPIIKNIVMVVHYITNQDSNVNLDKIVEDIIRDIKATKDTKTKVDIIKDIKANEDTKTREGITDIMGNEEGIDLKDNSFIKGFGEDNFVINGKDIENQEVTTARNCFSSQGSRISDLCSFI